MWINSARKGETAHYSTQSQWHNKLSQKEKKKSPRRQIKKESVKRDEEENWNSRREDESDTFTQP